MNKLFKLIWINILNLFDINKIIIAKNEGVKSNLEKKSIIIVIIALVYGFILYNLFIKININEKFLILNISFLISSFLCFFLNLFLVESAILKSTDLEKLFALPLTRHQILFSKLFTIYLKNLFYVIIVMAGAFFSYAYFNSNLEDTFILMYILSCLIIPLIPIILATIIVYINNYYKTKTNNSHLFKIIKIILIIVFIILTILTFKDINTNSFENLLKSFVDKSNTIYFIGLLFNNSLSTINILWFILLITIPISFIYIYMFTISNNYLKICSLLKGEKKKISFEYKKTHNLHKIGGLIRKEFLFLFKNKFYLFNSFGITCILSFILFLFLNIFDISLYYEIPNFEFYLNLYVPTLLILIVAISNSSICSMSIEKNYIKFLLTLPLKINNIIFVKWLVSVFLGTIFVIINGLIVLFTLNLSKWSTIYSFLLPFIALMFVNLVSVILDYRFIEKNEMTDNAIIKQRLIGMIPPFLAIILGIGPFFLPVYKKYEILLGSYTLILFISQIICLLYLFLNRKKLLENLNK